MTKIISMWSGPRNLSTAMMYSFGARGDCRVVDEPFYAAYLTRTGLDHPMRNEILASQLHDPKAVVAELFLPMSEPIFYQKHMTHHILPHWDMGWVQDATNVFLIRHPARVIASYAKKREGPTLDDLGYAQQVRIFKAVEAAIVIDSADIRADPAGMLQKLCARIGIAWDAGMLNWPAGGHASDGIWAAHWYEAVHGSTGFGTVEGDMPQLTGNYKNLAEAAMPHFEALAAHKIT
jgi:hypothetical protein